MNLALRYGMIGLLLTLGQQGIAGMIQDPTRIRLLGFCGKLEPSALKFDEQGNLSIDLSSLPPLTPDRRKTVCQVKIPYTADTKVMAGSWQLDADYKAAQGSKMLSTVRFSNVGEVGEARIWSIEEPNSSPLSWTESFSTPGDPEQEPELKITWTHEMKLPKDGNEPTTACIPSFQLKRLVIAAPVPEAPTPTTPVE